MQTNRQPQLTRLLLVALATLALLAASGHPTLAARTVTQQGKANAALLGLWEDKHGLFVEHRPGKDTVTVAEVAVALRGGAQVNAHDAGGYTALICSACRGNLGCVRYLVDHGADVNATVRRGATALMEAALYGHVNCVRFLISKGAPVNARDRDGGTALMVAAVSGNADCAAYLISRGATINARDTVQGDTALSMASYRGSADCVRLLLSKGADANSKDKYGRSALKIAQMFKHVNIAAILKAAGAKD